MIEPTFWDDENKAYPSIYQEPTWAVPPQTPIIYAPETILSSIYGLVWDC